MVDSPRDVFLRLVNGVCDGPYDELAGLYAERTHVTHPIHPLSPPPLLTRAELNEHFTGPPPVGRTLRRRPVDIVVHETADPEVIVAEFAYQGEVAETGESFRVPCVFVMRVRDGLIVESRDYIDPIASARSWGLLDNLLSALRPGAAPPPAPGPTDGTENPGRSGTLPPAAPGPTDGAGDPGAAGAGSDR